MDAADAHRLLDEELAEPDHVLIDWVEFWSDDTTDAEWLAEPLVPARRSVALFAAGGTGKSLLALWLAARLATGRDIFGISRPPVHVLYLDYEMTRADLRERLEDMGYGSDVDLKHLHYALLPDLAPLDSQLGGDAVIALAHRVEAELVVIDTFGRAVAGEENDADTVQRWYRWTGLRLKNQGRGFVRIDHAGKDHERGQRGTSAKNDDVDVVWKMTRMDGDQFRLTAAKRRLQWVPETVELEQTEVDNELGYRLLVGATTYPAGTADLAAELDRLDVPVQWGKIKAARALRDVGAGKANATVLAAQKYRRDQAENRSPTALRPFIVKTGPGANGTGDKTPGGPPPGPVGTRGHGEGGQVGGSPVGDPPGPHPAPTPRPGGLFDPSTDPDLEETSP